MTNSKMSRFITGGILALSCFLLFITLHKNSDQYRYSELILSVDQYASLKSGKTESSEDLITRLTFNELPAFYDCLTGRWLSSVSGKENNSSPSVGYAPANKNVRIAFRGNFPCGSEIPFLAYDENVYREYRLAATTLPLARIEYQKKEITRDPLPMRFTLLDNRLNAGNPVTESEGFFHLRGWSTVIFPKNAFRLTLTEQREGKEAHENKTSLLDLRNDGDWLLYPAYNDSEKIRNVFSSNLWFNSCGSDNSFGIQNGMEYRYIELFLNDEYWGLYALGYPVDALQMNIFPNNRGHYDEFLFKAKEWGPHHESNPEYDGLILQFDAPESDLNNGIGIMKSYFQQLEDGAPGRLYHNDEKNVLDIWLYMKLIQAWDTVRFPGKMKNMMYTIKMSDTGRKILYAPWDMDIAWGNIIGGAGKNFTLSYFLEPDDNSYEMTVNPVSVLLQQNDSEIRQKICQRYHELRSDGWSDTAVDSMLDSFEKDIFDSGAYQRDIERWPDCSRQDPDLKLSAFRNYVHLRFTAMDAFMDDMEKGK